MSWTPNFMIEKKDFIELQDELFSLDEIHAWEFSINKFHGVVIVGGDSSNSNAELHAVIQNKKHWILDGEGVGCEDCVGWGDSLDRYSYKWEKKL